MTDFEYERNIYNRNFLNCSQRQGIVALESSGCNTANLFYNAQVSTDVIREQIFINKTPRYNFIYDGLRGEDYETIGVNYAEMTYHSFEQVIPTLVKIIDRDGFVLISCDVFLIPHRPEIYYKKHINHFVTLLSYDERNEQWQAIDDVSSGHLAKFTFTSEYLGEICNAPKEKVFRIFKRLSAKKSETSRASVEMLFVNSRINRSDNFLILEDMAEIGNDKSGMESMANVFSVILGSRLCFSKFLKQYPNFSKAEKLSTQIAIEARSVRDLFNIYTATESFQRHTILPRVKSIIELEKELSTLLECQKHSACLKL